MKSTDCEFEFIRVSTGMTFYLQLNQLWAGDMHQKKKPVSLQVLTVVRLNQFNSTGANFDVAKYQFLGTQEE